MNIVTFEGIKYKLVPLDSDEKIYNKNKNANMSDEDVRYIIEEEGIGYTLECYCSYGDIKRKKTRVLFGQAVDAIIKLKKHLGVE